MWVVIGLETGVDWPMETVDIKFKGQSICMRPETDDLAPSIAIKYDPPQTYDQAAEIGTEFLSSLAWATGRYVRETIWSGGSIAMKIGKSPTHGSRCSRFREDNIPETTNARAKLALAIYREALGTNSVAYQFLGFFKVLNILHHGGKAQENWINQTLPKLTDFRVKERLAQLRFKSPDLGNYLYVSGRCAVAHAFNTPVVNPDNPEDRRRLSECLLVIRALAEYAIEHELGVKSTSTYYHEHLFELDGFRLSPQIVTDLKDGKPVDLTSLPAMPVLAIRLRDQSPYGCFEGVSANRVDASDGKLVLGCQSNSGQLQIGIVLDFANERLIFEPFNWVEVADDGSVSAAETLRDVLEFQRDYFKNGVLEIWDAASNTLLGRCRPFLPMNVRPDGPNRWLTEQIDIVTKVIERRRESLPPSQEL